MSADDLEIPKEVAERIRRPVGWLAKLRMTGEGPPYLKIGSKIYYRRRDVDAWLADCERTSTAQPAPCREERPESRASSNTIQEPLGRPRRQGPLAAARKGKPEPASYTGATGSAAA